MRIKLIILSLIALQLYAQSPIMNIDGRKTVSLNGDWKVIIDPYENGYYSYRYTERSDGFFKNVKPANRWDLIEYDFDSGGQLHVPGDWNSQDERLFFYEGTVWYKRSFDFTPEKGKRYFLYFGAVNYEAKVYLNGEKLGEHVGGFTPFNFEITDKIRDGENFVVVKVDNKRHAEGVPTLNTDWWNFGGITRRADLVETPGTFIRDYSIQLKKSVPNTINGFVQLDGTDVGDVTIKIPELSVEASFKLNSSGRSEIELTANPELWTPENPKLYSVIIESGTDRVVDEIGFRTIETRGSEILLNGTPVFLRGVCIHEDAPFRNGRAYSEAEDRTLLEWAKEMNCNYVRLAHYPHNEEMVRLADKLGLMVWSEIPVYWTIQWENAGTLQNALNQLRENINRDKNRASVIIWSMANETPVTEQRTRFLKRLVDEARELDPTRLISAAMERIYVDDHTLLINDPFGKYVDVLGCNEYVGWYDGLPGKCKQIEWKSIYNKPLIMSEFGGGAKFGLHADSLTRWSEEFQTSIYRNQINMLRKIPFLAGTTPWILKDFMSPRRLLPNIQDYYNLKGLISNRGEKKEAFYIMKDFYEKIRTEYKNK